MLVASPHIGPLQKLPGTSGHRLPNDELQLRGDRKKFQNRRVESRDYYRTQSTAAVHGTAGFAKCAHFRSGSGSNGKVSERRGQRARLLARAFARASTPSPAACAVACGTRPRRRRRQGSWRVVERVSAYRQKWLQTVWPRKISRSMLQTVVRLGGDLGRFF